MSEQSSYRVISLRGELDISRKAEIGAALQIAGPGPAVLVDLSDVQYADSTIIAEMLRFREDAQRCGRRLAVLVGDPRFRRVLQYAGLQGAFALFEDRGAALTYLSAEGTT